MIWLVGGYAIIMTLIAARLGIKEYDARAEAARLRFACERAEDALRRIADMQEVEAASATILSDDALARRLGVDIKSRLS